MVQNIQHHLLLKIMQEKLNLAPYLHLIIMCYKEFKLHVLQRINC